jgi:hypothetical protein
VNKDGHTDLVVAENNLTVMLGDGREGLLRTPPAHTGHRRRRRALLADFNGDGVLISRACIMTG